MLQDSPTPMECPLCMEEFDLDDKSFFPCTCGYQVSISTYSGHREVTLPNFHSLLTVYSRKGLLSFLLS